jgi:uncharacterized protein (TIGR04141 family)
MSVTTKSAEERLTISLYLLRSSQVADFEASLFGGTNVLSLDGDLNGGKFATQESNPTTPPWFDEIQKYLPAQFAAALDMTSQSPGGLLLMPHASKYFVISFGSAWMKLKDMWLEPSFGKRVALNIIPKGQVVEVRAEQVFAKRHIASERAPRASSVKAFGFESDRDLIGAVEGIPESKYQEHIGESVRGGDSLRINIIFSKLKQVLDVVADRFDSVDYKSIWPEFDNLVPIRDTNLEQQLCDELDKVFGMPKQFQLLPLAAPSIRSGERGYPASFVIGRNAKNVASAPYLLHGAWESALAKERKSANVKAAQSTTVHLLDENNERIGYCSFYDCLGYEANLAGSSYVLSSGVWYQANKQFVTDINAVVGGLPTSKYPLAAWNMKCGEGEFNADCCKNDASLTLFDAKNVFFGGGSSQFEFCDMFHLPSKTLYFVKQPSKSTGVSHLCEQVRRTVELFFSVDDGFRKKLVDKTKKLYPSLDLTWLNQRPRNGDWNLCLVLMGKEAKDIALFGRCGIARLVKELQKGGHEVQFLKV